MRSLRKGIFETVFASPLYLMLLVLTIAVLFLVLFALNIFGLRDWLAGYLRLFRI